MDRERHIFSKHFTGYVEELYDRIFSEGMNRSIFLERGKPSHFRHASSGLRAR
jgi:hypothetical protein